MAAAIELIAQHLGFRVRFGPHMSGARIFRSPACSAPALGRATVLFCLLLTAVSTARAYPHHLVYFNELAGGPGQGHEHLLHSSADYGQNILFLKEWMQNAGRHTCLLSCCPHFDPRDLGVDCTRTTIDEVPRFAGAASRSKLFICCSTEHVRWHNRNTTATGIDALQLNIPGYTCELTSIVGHSLCIFEVIR